MEKIFHVADPKFWSFLKRHGNRAYSQLTPALGQKQLDISCEGFAECVVLAGGTVTGVELVATRPNEVVKVTMTNAPRPLHLVLTEGIEIKYQGDQDQIQQQILHQRRRAGGALLVFYDFFWETPDEVHVAVFERPNPNQPGYVTEHRSGAMPMERLQQTEHRSGAMPMERLQQMVREGKVPFVKQPSTNRPVACIALPMRPTDLPREAKGVLVLPPEVKPRHFLEAAQDLIRFAEFARELHPRLSKRRRRAA